MEAPTDRNISSSRMMGEASSADAGTELDSLVATAGLEPLEPSQSSKFGAYLDLLLRWNARMNLTAVRDRAGIMRRHFVESIACAQFLRPDMESLLDFGSGAGFPGIPIAICRSELSVTLAEAQTKKAAFLREAVRALELKCRIWSRRAEELNEHFDCVVMRAVDRMEIAVAGAAELVRPGGCLGILTTEACLTQLKLSAGSDFDWPSAVRLPGSEQRVLGLGSKRVSAR